MRSHMRRDGLRHLVREPRQAANVLDFLHTGDGLVVHRLDRPGRSTRDVPSLVYELDGTLQIERCAFPVLGLPPCGPDRVLQTLEPSPTRCVGPDLQAQHLADRVGRAVVQSGRVTPYRCWRPL